MSQLLIDINTISIIDWKLTTREKDIKRTVRLFGMSILGKKFFGIKVHSVFVPKTYNLELPQSDNYRRWDSINGWNEMSDGTVKSLTREILTRKASLSKTKQNKNKGT